MSSSSSPTCHPTWYGSWTPLQKIARPISPGLRRGLLRLFELKVDPTTKRDFVSWLVSHLYTTKPSYEYLLSIRPYNAVLEPFLLVMCLSCLRAKLLRRYFHRQS